MYACNSCDKSYAFPQGLQTHVRDVHGMKEKLEYSNVYKCNLCDKIFE